MDPLGIVIVVLAALAGAIAAVPLWRWLRGRIEADRRWIQQTALRFSPDPPQTTMWLAVLYAGRVLVLVALLAALPSVIAAMGLWVLSLFLPPLVAEKMWERRRAKIDDQLPLSIRFMANGVGAGLTLVQAIQRLAEQAPSPIAQEFRIMANRYALGEDVEAMLLQSKSRLRLPDFDLFATALLINREMGGDIGVTLQRIARSIERLKELRMNMLAQTSEGRTNIKFLAVTPVFILLMMQAIDPEGLNMLFTTVPGMILLLIAAALTGLGVFWASRIVATEI